MKKKGLIVATIVMVLVLAVSLTTATYAWFTTTSATSIQSINISAAAGADVKIGVLKDQLNYDSSATQDSFLTGTVVISNTGASGEEPGLGSNLETGLVLSNISMATGMGAATTFTEDNPKTLEAGHYVKVDDTYVLLTAANLATHASAEKSYSMTAGTIQKLNPSDEDFSDYTIVMASGTTTKNDVGAITGSTVTASTIEAAAANSDYSQWTYSLTCAPPTQSISRYEHRDCTTCLARRCR